MDKPPLSNMENSKSYWGFMQQNQGVHIIDPTRLYRNMWDNETEITIIKINTMNDKSEQKENIDPEILGSDQIKEALGSTGSAEQYKREVAEAVDIIKDMQTEIRLQRQNNERINLQLTAYDRVFGVFEKMVNLMPVRNYNDTGSLVSKPSGSYYADSFIRRHEERVKNEPLTFDTNIKNVKRPLSTQDQCAEFNNEKE